MDPGCTAGIYLVPVNDDCDIESAIDARNPKCPSISLMQANNWGFTMAEYPCNDGVHCGSRCHFDMGTIYDSESYGPGGRTIDTSRPFVVHTDFVLDYTGRMTEFKAHMWN